MRLIETFVALAGPAAALGRCTRGVLEPCTLSVSALERTSTPTGVERVGSKTQSLRPDPPVYTRHLQASHRIAPAPTVVMLKAIAGST